MLCAHRVFRISDLHFLIPFGNQPCGLFFSISLSLSGISLAVSSSALPYPFRESALRSLLQHFLIPFGNQPCGLFFSISLSPSEISLMVCSSTLLYPFRESALRSGTVRFTRLTSIMGSRARKQPPLNILLHHSCPDCKNTIFVTGNSSRYFLYNRL
jgi:hypothetical protein